MPQHTGTTASWPPARSALELRLILSVFGALTSGLGAALTARVGTPIFWPAALAVLAAIAAVDFAVVALRMAGRRRGNRSVRGREAT